MKKINSFMALLLAVMLVFSMTACGGGTGNGDEENTDTDSTEVQTEVSEDETSEKPPESSETAAKEELTTEINCTEGILDLQVIQVMANGVNNDTGELYRMTDFVAGKNTLLQIYFEQPQVITQDGSMTMAVYRDGEEIAELLPTNSGEAQTATFYPRTIADAANWAAGEYVFTFKFGDMEAVRSVSMRDAKKIKVLAVPVVANYAGNIVSCEGAWKTAGNFTKACYPIANDGMEYILGNELDLSGPEYDLTTEDGGYNVWEALTQLQTPNNDYELILGFVRDRQGAEGTLQGFTYGIPANIITESDGDMEATVAHEIAHCYNVGDEYPGGTINNLVNPAPYGMEGSDWINRDLTVAGNKEVVVSANDTGNENTGSLINPDQIAANLVSMEFLNNAGSFMGSGSFNMEDYWITADIWKQLFKSFVYGDSGFGEESAGETADTTAVNNDGEAEMSSKTQQSTTVYALDITGKINNDDTFEPTPWFGYETDSSNINAATAGEYSVVCEDKNGTALSASFFDASFYTQSNPPQKLDFSSINVSIAFDKNTKKVKILHGDKEIYSKEVSENTPEINFEPMDDILSGEQTITWTGTDGDGDEISYELWYCPSEEEFINIASGIKETSYTVNFDTLQGTEDGYFYIYGTDGVNTGENYSDDVKVEYKAPEFITEQQVVPEYKITDEIIFDADIYDMQDGWLYDDDTVAWSLDGREYMTGSMLWIYPYELTPGTHEFTVTATNSQGISAQKVYSFTVLDDESALPQDWSTEDIKNALANGFVAPLANVNSAITRGQFAKLMSTLYFTVANEDAEIPDYEENVVTDCGNDDYDQFLMVKLGVMTADGGKFSPNGNLTEKEAAAVMYRICSLADPAVAEPMTSEDDMAQVCINSDVMSESGDNIYTAETNITGRLALVRCNRLFKAIFE